MILITVIMKQPRSKTRLYYHRAILVVGALLCLCVSDSAGPRLLPLFTPSEVFAVKPFPLDNCPWASRVPNSNREPSPYIEMVVGSQYRVRDRHHEVQPATHSPKTSLQLQPSNLADAPETYAPINFKAASLSKPTGRAPPHFA
jgi:hypothetical protein